MTILTEVCYQGFQVRRVPSLAPWREDSSRWPDWYVAVPSWRQVPLVCFEGPTEQEVLAKIEAYWSCR